MSTSSVIYILIIPVSQREIVLVAEAQYTLTTALDFGHDRCLVFFMSGDIHRDILFITL